MDTKSVRKMRSILSIYIDGVEHSHLLEQERLMIGRSIQSAIRINHPEVSRIQALLVRDAEGKFELVDGDGSGKPSTNGTFVDGQRIVKAWLYSGAQIHFGSGAVTARFYQLGGAVFTPRPEASPAQDPDDDLSTDLVFEPAPSK